VNFARLVASGFGSGLAPKAPGTAGSLAALLIGALLMLLLPPLALPFATLLASLGGLWAIGAARVEGDPGWVVIDEFAGMWITMLGLARVTPIGLIVAFLLFRLLDIVKPGPVGWADRQKGAAGIMADDIIAGAIGAGILWALRSRFPGLLGGGLG
jgi:phosphatidylglycerophosphatase A